MSQSAPHNYECLMHNFFRQKNSGYAIVGLALDIRRNLGRHIYEELRVSEYLFLGSSKVSVMATILSIVIPLFRYRWLLLLRARSSLYAWTRDRLTLGSLISEADVKKSSQSLDMSHLRILLHNICAVTA